MSEVEMLAPVLTFILVSTQILLISSEEIDRKELYKKLCYNSTMANPNYSLETFDQNEPEGGWPIILGDDVSQNLLGSRLIGKKLTMDAENYEGMCLTVTKSYTRSANKSIGGYNGFGVHYDTNYECWPAEGYPGAFKCLLGNSLHTKYTTEEFFYTMYTDKKSVSVVVFCFSEENIGWVTISESSFLTEEEVAAVKKQVTSLGFDSNNIVYLYEPKCKDGTLKTLNVKLHK